MSLYSALKGKSQAGRNEAIPVGLIRHLRSERKFRTGSRPVEQAKSLTGSPKSPGSPHSLFATFSGLASAVRVQNGRAGEVRIRRGRRTVGKELRLAAALLEVAQASTQERRTILREYAGQKAVWSTDFRSVFAYKNYSIPATKQRNREALKSTFALAKGRKHVSLQW